MKNGAGYKVSNFVTSLLLIVGLVLFATLLWHIGLQTIASSISKAGWYLPLAILPQALLNSIQSCAWRIAFLNQCRAPKVTMLFRSNLAAKAITVVTPSIAQSGELMKIHLLVLAGFSADVSTASVISAKIAIAIAEFFYIVTGLVVSISDLVVDPSVITPVILGVTAMGAILLGVVAWQRTGLFRTFIRFSKRFNMFATILKRYEESLHSIDKLLKSFVCNYRRFWTSCFLFLLGWSVGVFEVWLLLWILEIPVDVVSAFLINIWLVIVIRLTIFVPANLGTFEAGAIMIFSVLGLSPENAMAFALLSRLPQLFWAATGFGIIATVYHGRHSETFNYGQYSASIFGKSYSAIVKKMIQLRNNLQVL